MAYGNMMEQKLPIIQFKKILLISNYSAFIRITKEIFGWEHTKMVSINSMEVHLKSLKHNEKNTIDLLDPPFGIEFFLR